MSQGQGHNTAPRVRIELVIKSLTLSQLSYLYLQEMIKCMGALRSSKFSQIRPPTAELAALEHLKKSLLTYNGKNGVANFSPLFLIGSISYLQEMMTYMRAWMKSDFWFPLQQIMEKMVLPHFLGCFLSDPFHTCR